MNCIFYDLALKLQQESFNFKKSPVYYFGLVFQNILTIAFAYEIFFASSIVLKFFLRSPERTIIT